MKRVISFLLCICMLSGILYQSPCRAEENTVINYSEWEMKSIESKYNEYSSRLEAYLSNSENRMYWKLIKACTDNKTFAYLLEISSAVVKASYDEVKYTQLLVNLITISTGNLVEQIEKQTQYDNLKTAKDYVFDVIDIGLAFIGMESKEIIDDFSTVVEAVTGGTELIIDSADNAKYYKAIVQDYAQSKDFLDAVIKYADDKELKSAAETLAKVNHILFEEQIKYMYANASDYTSFSLEFFYKNMFVDLLKNTKEYKNDSQMKEIIDMFDVGFSKIMECINLFEFTFKVMMLGGDLLFGTSDTFNRYQEMKAVSEIAEALDKANQNVAMGSADLEDKVSGIQKKCNYYKMLINVHLRGEYLLYSLVKEDANIISEFRNLLESILIESDQSTDADYEKITEDLISTYNLIEDIFEFSAWGEACSKLHENPDLTALTDKERDAVKNVLALLPEYDTVDDLNSGEKIYDILNEAIMLFADSLENNNIVGNIIADDQFIEKNSKEKDYFHDGVYANLIFKDTVFREFIRIIHSYQNPKDILIEGMTNSGELRFVFMDGKMIVNTEGRGGNFKEKDIILDSIDVELDRLKINYEYKVIDMIDEENNSKENRTATIILNSNAQYAVESVTGEEKTFKTSDEELKTALISCYWRDQNEQWSHVYKFHEDGTWTDHSLMDNSIPDEEVFEEGTYQVTGNELIIRHDKSDYPWNTTLIYADIAEDHSDLAGWNSITAYLQESGYTGKVFFDTDGSEEFGTMCLIPYDPEEEETENSFSSGGALSDEQLNRVKADLGVPENLDVRIEQSEQFYYDAGERWLVAVSIYYNEEMIAGAHVDTDTAELIKNIWMYSE